MTDDTTGTSATAPPPEAATTTVVDVRPVRATAKYLRSSAQKGRLVVDMIRGRRVADAYAILEFSNRAVARDIRKVLHSAVSNAENNNGMSAEDLYVEAAWVDEGPTLKRWKPRARGRADRINKRTCHITIVVNEAPEDLDRRSRASAKPSGDRAARVAASRGEAPPAAAKKSDKDGGAAPKSKAKSKKGAADGDAPAADATPKSAKKQAAADAAEGDKPKAQAKAKQAAADAEAPAADPQPKKAAEAAAAGAPAEQPAETTETADENKDADT